MAYEQEYSFKVEEGVPVPAAGRGARPPGYNVRYPFPIMKAGDSFLIEGIDVGDRKRARVSASTFAMRNPGVRFVSRDVGVGLRIWRVE